MAASYNGVLLPHVGTIEWSLTLGLDPFETTIELPRDFAGDIYAKHGGRPGILRIGADEYKGVYLLSRTADPRRDTLGLVFVDARWLLEYTGISADYNVRERVGNIRLVGPGTLQQQQVADPVKFRAHSLIGGLTPWTTEQAIEDVLSRQRNETGIDFEPIPNPFNRDLPIDDFSETGSAKFVMTRLLAQAPGYRWGFSREGKLYITDGIDETIGAAELAKVGATVRNAGWIDVHDRRFIRPRHLNIYFVAEQELRFDHDEDAEEALSLGAQPTTTVVEGAAPPRRLECVLEMPTRTFVSNGQQLGEGSIIPLWEVIRQLPQQADPVWALNFIVVNSGFGPLTYRLLREFILQPWFLQQYYVTANDAPQLSWFKLMREIQASFRRNFRITPLWREKIRDFRVSRVLLADPLTVSFVKTKPYTDVTFIPAQSALVLRSGFFLRRNNEGWVVRGYDDQIATATTIDGEFRIKDQAAGYVRVQFDTSPYDEEERIIPGILKVLPSVTDRGQLFALDNISRASELESGWKLAAIFTCVQSAPASNGRFHLEFRGPATAERVLGRPVGPCLGPAMDIYVSDTPTTRARFAWDDAQRIAIEQAFVQGGFRPRSLLANSDVVDAIADGITASVYAGQLDTMDGFATSPTGRGYEPRGTIAATRTFSAPGSPAYSQIYPSGKMYPLDFAAFLPDQIQRFVLGQVQP